MNYALEQKVLNFSIGDSIDDIIFNKIPTSWLDTNLNFKYELHANENEIQYYFYIEDKIDTEDGEKVVKRDFWGMSFSQEVLWESFLRGQFPIHRAKRFLLGELIKLKNPPLLYNGIDFEYNEDFEPSPEPEYREEYKM